MRSLIYFLSNFFVKTQINKIHWPKFNEEKIIKVLKIEFFMEEEYKKKKNYIEITLISVNLTKKNYFISFKEN